MLIEHDFKTIPRLGKPSRSLPRQFMHRLERIVLVASQDLPHRFDDIPDLTGGCLAKILGVGVSKDNELIHDAR